VGARKKAKRGDDPIYKKPLPKGAVKPFVGLAHQLCGKDKVCACHKSAIHVRCEQENWNSLLASSEARLADLQAMLSAGQTVVVSCVLAHMYCRESRSRMATPAGRLIIARRQRDSTAVQTYQLSSLLVQVEPSLQRCRQAIRTRRMATRQLRAPRMASSTP
jgi:hypothetical protein